MVVTLPTAAAFGLPRYPNVWFHVSKSLTPTYEQAVHFVITQVANCLGVRSDAGHAHDVFHCDARALLRNLQPYRGYANHRMNHSHALDIRYYYRWLKANELEETHLEFHGKVRPFYRVAAQVRYEASLIHHSPDDCPICGRSGDFANSGEDVEREVRDPLGVELCLHGTIRGRPVTHPSGQRILGMKSLAMEYGLYFGTIKPADGTPMVGCVAILGNEDVEDSDEDIGS